MIKEVPIALSISSYSKREEVQIDSPFAVEFYDRMMCRPAFYGLQNSALIRERA